MKIALDLPQSLADYLESEAHKRNSDVQQMVIQLLWALVGDRSTEQNTDEQESEAQILSLLQSWEESEGESSPENTKNFQDQTCDVDTNKFSDEQSGIIALLESWIDDQDDDNEPSATEDLLQSLSNNRFSERSLFPETKQGRTW
ncbi:MAG: hypothetical protein HC795_06365 [Coleofasciculaceae cyanobacterium RL_1_1]|nr:hypothetical protein [Coleofasciculaceae cyanobacterium RL_1_1]